MENEEDLSLLIMQLYNMLHDIRWEINDAQDKLNEIEEKAKKDKNLGIRDVDYFIKRLIAENLYTNEMKDFIDKYMKFYNK